MNNLKKIGMTALAASLVSTSVFAGELAVTGSASIAYENYTTAEDAIHNNKTFTQSNAINFNGSTELDNGMNVAVHFELDDGSNGVANGSAADHASVWDNHSITISSDAMGTFVFSGHGGSSAQSALDTTAAGDIFDNFDGTAGIAATSTLRSSKASNNIMKYTLPTVMDDLSMAVSYQAGGNANAGAASSMAYGATYTGVEGLSVSYGYGENNANATLNADVTTVSASYAYGSFTLKASETENDELTVTDQKLTSMSVAYTVSDNLSLTYGVETLEAADWVSDADYSKIEAAYTTGGLTVTLGTQTAQNGEGAAADLDVDYNYLTLGFAF
jgi:outer membrane protein OmpU